MDKFCKLTIDERKPYFEVAANKAALPFHIIEKDFWVCWTLRRLFSLETIAEYLIFKGGTSLSKAFAVIERFSEDIDLSIHRDFLGFTGKDDPENAPTNKKQQQKIEELGQACRKFVHEKLLPALGKEIEKVLGTDQGWTLEIDPADPDQQSLLFSYPSEKAAATPAYIAPKVKIEMGARSDHWPAGDHPIVPYAWTHEPKSMADATTAIKVMEVERTFWEKATILHEYAHYPEGKKPRARQSRHYYDFFRLLNSAHKAEAVKRLDLLERVAEHKSIYFRSARARYEEAKPGTLKLIPPDHVLEEMKRDYALMREMFFTDPPEWDEILRSIREFETEFNRPRTP